jgi:hypothetical protein
MPKAVCAADVDFGLEKRETRHAGGKSLPRGKPRGVTVTAEEERTLAPCTATRLELELARELQTGSSP